MYCYGLGVEINLSKAKKYFEISAKNGNSEGFIHLGTLYLNGQGCEKDYKKAKELFEISAKLNNEVGLFYLGCLYHFGFGIDHDYQKAKYYYELSAEKNYSNALVNLGCLYLLGLLGKIDFDKTRECFEKAAKLNNQTALLNLGCIYADGIGIPIDHLRAKHYFELVVNQTDSKFPAYNNASLAYINLANLYLSGKYFKKDIKRAIGYLECASTFDDSTAFLYLGNIFYLGKGVKKDYFKAFKYYEKSSQIGNQIALDILGTFYMNGIYVKPNFLKAKYYFELAVQNSNINSLYNLGCLYSSGELCDIDINKAIQYFKECIQDKFKITLIKNYNFTIFVYKTINNNNYYPSYNKLGLIYLLHFNDLDSANNYIKEAAFAEFPFAQNNYGLLLKYYLNNKENAKYMFERSSKHNFSLAEFNLGNFYEENDDIEKAFHYYALASEHEFEPLEFRGKNFDHSSLMISKRFIVCLADLKLVKYYYSERKKDSDYIFKAKQYFCNAISRLIIQDKYLFAFKYNKNDFSYLKNFPLFGFSNQIIDGKNQSEMTHNSQLNIKLKNNVIENVIFDEVIFQDPESLFDYVCHNVIEMAYFIKIIDEIIETMKLILYSPPYSILFGCLNAFQNISNKENKKKNIDHFFYDGFGI